MNGAASRLDIFAFYHRRTLASLIRLSADGGLPSTLDLDGFTVVPAPPGLACDIVVDAALVHGRAAAALGLSPLDLARSIAGDLADVAWSATVDVAGPGFVNVTLRPAAVMDAVASMLRGSAPDGAQDGDDPSTAVPIPAALSPDEARAAVTAVQVAALASAAGRPVPSGNLRPALERTVVRGQAGAGRADTPLAGVDADAFRFAVALCRRGATLHVDPSALAERSRDNPAFWIPYAHARCRGVLRRAAVAMPAVALGRRALAEAELSRLTDPDEIGLARVIVRSPHVVAVAAATADPHRLAAHLRDVAQAVHSQWNRSKDQPQLRFVNEEERDLAKARLALVTASTHVLKSGLGILGVNAPDEMR